MLRASLWLAMLFSLTALVPAPPASAAPHRTNAPPGNSAIDEYLETVPGASGNARPRPLRKGGDATLTPAQRADLEALGADGQALAQVVEATAPPPRASSPGRSTPSASAPAVSGRSPVAAALSATTGSDEGSALGWLLPGILLVSLLGALAFAVLRRRGHT